MKYLLLTMLALGLFLGLGVFLMCVASMLAQ
jgi:hypothetical protein